MTVNLAPESIRKSVFVIYVLFSVCYTYNDHVVYTSCLTPYRNPINVTILCYGDHFLVGMVFNEPSQLNVSVY